MPNNYLKTILIGAVLAACVVIGRPHPGVAQEVAAAARRLAATAQLAAGEDRLGVSGGRVIATAEVAEARLFLAEARRNSARLPEPAAGTARAALDQLDSLVAPGPPPP